MESPKTPAHPDARPVRSETLARALAAQRSRIAEALTANLSGWDKYASQVEEDRSGFQVREIHVFVDYLILLFRGGDQTFRDLYVGEKLKQLYDPRDTPELARERRNRIVASDRLSFTELLRPGLPAGDLDLLDRELEAIEGVICEEAKTTAKVLLIGDCLYLDLISFLTGPLLRRGIVLRPAFLTSKSPVETRKSIQAMANEKFDAIFYSPFTYEFSLEYTRTQYPRAAFSSAREITKIALDSIIEVERTLDAISDLFECNVFVHNSANIRRHDGTWKERAKSVLTGRARSTARRAVNAWLTEYCRLKNAASFPHVFEIDETGLFENYSEDELGKYFYRSELQHPAVMGRALAPVYEEILAVQLRLLPVKLIVCDLDNTLWDGVIGEGEVSHFHERQRVLQRLRKKGVLLAVCSKNDPRNVHWRDGTLDSSDFVASVVNWEAKALNIRRIAQDLNLKTKDFLFLDDRADERGLVEMANPEVRTMDPNDARTWKLLERWVEILPEQTEMDRTQFYKQREQRQQFLESSEAEAEHRELLQKLDLRVKIRPAASGDIARAAELVNRTNQFNLQGSRTSIREMTVWHRSNDWEILAVDAADKFGDMGTVSIVVLRYMSDRIEIPIFVLSCRVFGYGIETAILNAVKAAAQPGDGPGLEIHGLYRETPNNEPCRKVYADNGFEWEQDRWTFRGGSPDAEPAWLNVVREGLRNTPSNRSLTVLAP